MRAATFGSPLFFWILLDSLDSYGATNFIESKLVAAQR
jgi:hypothetical protein